MNYVIRFQDGTQWWARDADLAGLLVAALKDSATITVERAGR